MRTQVAGAQTQQAALYGGVLAARERSASASNSKSVPCSCGGTFTSGQYERHTGTYRHRAYIAAQCGRPVPPNDYVPLADPAGLDWDH